MKTSCLKAAGLIAVAAVFLALATGLTATAAPDHGRAERTIYAAIVGPQGPLNTAVTPADLKVLEDGTEREITNVQLAQGPVSAVLLLDTTRAASNIFLDVRKAAADYASALFEIDPQSRVAIAEFGGVAMIKQPFTSSIDDIKAAMTKVVANDGGALMNEGLVAISEELAKETTPRRVIITINMEPADEFSQTRFDEVAQAVRDSGATVYAIVVQQGTRRDAGREQLQQALVSNTGGMRWVIQTPNQIPQRLAGAALLSARQWAVTFTRPDGEAPAKMTQVEVLHEGFRALTNMWSGQ